MQTERKEEKVLSRLLLRPMLLLQMGTWLRQNIFRKISDSRKRLFGERKHAKTQGRHFENKFVQKFDRGEFCKSAERSTTHKARGKRNFFWQESSLVRKACIHEASEGQGSRRSKVPLLLRCSTVLRFLSSTVHHSDICYGGFCYSFQRVTLSHNATPSSSLLTRQLVS